MLIKGLTLLERGREMVKRKKTNQKLLKGKRRPNKKWRKKEKKIYTESSFYEGENRDRGLGGG